MKPNQIDELVRPRITLIPPNDYLSTIDVAIVQQDLEEAVKLCERAKLDTLARDEFLARYTKFINT